MGYVRVYVRVSTDLSRGTSSLVQQIKVTVP